MKQFLVVCACLCVAGAGARAGALDDYLLTGDAINTTSFNTGLNWSLHLPPTAGNNYRTANNSMRTPADSNGTTNEYVFAGDRLTLDGGGIGWKSFGPVTIADLVCDGGSLSASADGCFGRLYGNLTINAGKTLSISANENNPRGFNIYSTISGSGNISVQMNQVTSLKQTYFFGDNSSFTGKIQLRGLGKFGVCAEEGMGANPATFTSNQLEFNGSTFIATNSLTLDDPNRGILLNNTLNAGSQIYPGGVFEVSGASSTVTVACVISGAGPLTKRGNGTLVLATDDTYTGRTTVEAGTLRLASGGSLASQTLVVTGSTAVVSGEGALGAVTLAEGGKLSAEKGGWEMQSLEVLNTTNVTFGLDLSAAVTNVTLIRVGGALTKRSLQVFQFVIDTNNTVEAPYQILSASNLAEFAACDFCVTPPWIGELSRVPDAGGGQVLLFTPTPSEKRAFLDVSDPLNTTAFVDDSKWSDGLSPTNPPTGVKTYVSTNQTMRTPYNATMTFGGKRLIMQGQNISLKGSNYLPTILDLTMMEESSFSMAEQPKGLMAGHILLRPVFVAGKTYAMRVTGNNSGRDLYLYSTLSGYGDLFMQNLGNPAYAETRYNILSPNPGFFGKIRADGHTNFCVRISDEMNLSANPPFFRADQLSFNGGGLSVTNGVTLDDANRGITLLSNGGVSPTDVNPGGFPTGTPVEERVYPGGCVLRPEGTNTLTVLCPITGPGSLTKRGSGVLVLGGDNTYTGLTEIVAGTLVPISTNALGSGPVLLKPEGRLLRRYPGPALSNGVELGGPIAFEAGSAVRVELEEGTSVPGNFTLPLFLLADGETVDPAEVPVEHAIQNYKAAVTTSAVGSRVLVSAQFAFQGSVMMLR